MTVYENGPEMIVPSIGLGPITSIYSVRPVVDSWPKPERVSMDVDVDAPTVKPVADLARLAVGAGWQCRITEAVGSWPSVGGRPSRQRLSYAVRCWKADRRAVAVYVEGASASSPWKWETLLMWTLETFPGGVPNITEFKALL